MTLCFLSLPTDNVHFQQSAQISKALVEAGVDFQAMVKQNFAQGEGTYFLMGSDSPLWGTVPHRGLRRQDRIKRGFMLPMRSWRSDIPEPSAE